LKGVIQEGKKPSEYIRATEEGGKLQQREKRREGVSIQAGSLDPCSFFQGKQKPDMVTPSQNRHGERRPSCPYCWGSSAGGRGAAVSLASRTGKGANLQKEGDPVSARVRSKKVPGSLLGK